MEKFIRAGPQVFRTPCYLYVTNFSLAGSIPNSVGDMTESIPSIFLACPPSLKATLLRHHTFRNDGIRLLRSR